MPSTWEHIMTDIPSRGKNGEKSPGSGMRVAPPNRVAFLHHLPPG